MKINLIKRVEIRRLFGRYDLTWDLNPDVNILVGINGSGKSTILRSISALLQSKTGYFEDQNIEGMKIIGTADNHTKGYSYWYNKKEMPVPSVEVEKDLIIPVSFINTFDVPINDKRNFSHTETLLDKRLKDLLYTIGRGRDSFSNYRFKATNFPEQADTINQRIRLLFGIIDRLFAETEKTIEINPYSNELDFQRGNDIISLGKLSSGEKQLLIIIFTVFLMEEQACVLLMDEPEISLHVGWQQQLIDVIRELNTHCQLIISTHSPSIFGEGWSDKVFFMDDLYN